MPRQVLEFLAELAWASWAWPALESAGDWPVMLFGLLCCLAGVVGGGLRAAGWLRELRAALGPASQAPPGRAGAAAWVLGRLVGVGLAGVGALAGGWGLVCLARVVAISV